MPSLNDPAIVLLGIYSMEFKTYIHMKTCTWTFITVLFKIAENYSQPRRPSVK
jgi:hypothetical protein